MQESILEDRLLYDKDGIDYDSWQRNRDYNQEESKKK